MGMRNLPPSNVGLRATSVMLWKQKERKSEWAVDPADKMLVVWTGRKVNRLREELRNSGSRSDDHFWWVLCVCFSPWLYDWKLNRSLCCKTALSWQFPAPPPPAPPTLLSCRNCNFIYDACTFFPLFISFPSVSLTNSLRAFWQRLESRAAAVSISACLSLTATRRDNTADSAFFFSSCFLAWQSWEAPHFWSLCLTSAEHKPDVVQQRVKTIHLWDVLHIDTYIQPLSEQNIWSTIK